MEVIAEAHAARHRASPVERGGSGDPSPWTALGVEARDRASPASACSAPTTSTGRTVAVVGLGQRRRRAGRAARRGRRASSWSPTSTRRKRELAERLGADVDRPATALTAEVDVLAPCALGGVLDDDTRPGAALPAIAGAANNQLADDALADAARRARDPVGAGLRLPTPAASSTSPSSSSPRATPPTGPTPASARSATRCAPSSPTPSRGRRRRWPPRWSWRAGAWPKPARAPRACDRPIIVDASSSWVPSMADGRKSSR